MSLGLTTSVHCTLLVLLEIFQQFISVLSVIATVPKSVQNFPSKGILTQASGIESSQAVSDPGILRG